MLAAIYTEGSWLDSVRLFIHPLLLTDEFVVH